MQETETITGQDEEGQPQAGNGADPIETQHKASSMLKIVVTQFLEHRFAVAGLSVIGFLILTALCAPIIGMVLGVDPYRQNIFNRYKPVMTQVEIPASSRQEEVHSFVRKNQKGARLVAELAAKQGYIKGDVSPLLSLPEFMEQLMGDEGLATKMENLDNADMNKFLDVKEGFTSFHYMGTDDLGRDVLIRLIYGTRVSITVGLLVAFCAAVIGLLIGSMAGYYGGMFDSIIMRLTDSLLSLPLVPVLIIFAAVDLKEIPVLGWFIIGNNESIAKMVLILCIFSWMTVARLVRASILSVKQKEFIFAARTLGASDMRIIMQHMVPNILAPLLVAVTLMIGDAILFESALSFLGLGIQPPTPTWGGMLNNAQELIFEAPLLAIFPGTLIFIVVISFNFIGDGLQDAIDPKAIRR